MWSRELLRAIYDEIGKQAREVVRPFTRGGKLDLGSPNTVGHVPEQRLGPHALTGDKHTASGLTTGHVLTATSATTFDFQAPTGGGGSLPWFNLMDYGAAGDGTTDDTAAIDAWLAAHAAAGGGVLYAPAGIYKTSGGHTIADPYVMRGDGMPSYDRAQPLTVFNCASATAVLFTQSAKIGRIESLALVNVAGSTPSAGAALLVDSAYVDARCDLAWCHVEGFYDNLDIKVADLWGIDHCIVINAVRYEVRVRNTVNNDAGDWQIANCFISQGQHTGSVGLRVESSGGGKVANTKFNGAAAPNRHDCHIQVANSTTATILLQVTNCSLENYGGDAISLTGPNWSMVIINGVQFGQYGNATGRAIVADSVDKLILANIIALSTTASSGAVIDLTNCDHVRIGLVEQEGFAATLAQSGCTDVIDASAGAGGLTTEDVQDIAGAMVVAGPGVTATYDDGAATLTVAASAWSILTDGASNLIFAGGDVVDVETYR